MTVYLVDVVVVQKEDNTTSLIIMITLPLACVSIMMVFVAYLCVRSHQELKSSPVTAKNTSQHFVDIVASNVSIGAQKALRTSSTATEEPQLCDNSQPYEQIAEERYTERKTKIYSSPNGSDKMYKQVTFV